MRLGTLVVVLPRTGHSGLGGYGIGTTQTTNDYKCRTFHSRCRCDKRDYHSRHL